MTTPHSKITWSDEEERLELIRQRFVLLKQGFDWMVSHEKRVEQNISLIERSKPIIFELVELGVSETFSLCLFLLGGIVNRDCVEQFRGELN